MDKKDTHIDEWLKAAAQQPAPDNAGTEVKQQAWSQMAALLDAEEEKDQAPMLRRPWYRVSWAAVLMPLTAAAGVFALTIWPVANYKEYPPEKQIITVRHGSYKDHGQTITGDTTASYANVQSGPARPADTAATYRRDTITAFAGLQTQVTPFTPAVPAGINRPVPVITRVPVYPNAAKDKAAQQQPGTTIPSSASNNNTANNKALVPVPTLANNQVTATANGIRNRDTGAVASAQGIPSALQNAILPGRKQTMPPGREGGKEKEIKEGVPGMSNNVFHPLRTINAFVLEQPSLSSNSRNKNVAAPALPGKGSSNRAGADTRWALQAGLLSPLGNAYGIKIGLLYAYPLGAEWQLQPHISGSFITGYDKHFEHTAVNRTRVDSVGGAGASLSHYKTDTVTTPYTVKNAFVGTAGINLAYVKNKLTLSTGLSFNYALPSGKKDSTITHTGTVRIDSTNVQLGTYTSPAFSTGGLAGKHNLSWNLDAAYYVLPRLQVGVNYRVVLLKSAGAKGFTSPVKAIQDNSLLELYIRIPIGK